MAFNLEIKSKFKNRRVHVVQDKTLWASSGYTLYRSYSQGERWEKIGQIPVKFPRSVTDRLRPLRRLFRTGIRKVQFLTSGVLLIIAEGRIYRLMPDEKELKETGQIQRGRGPLNHGCCVDDKGNIYYGEYWLNPNREVVHIYRSSDDGRSWQAVHSFPQGAIRHIHALQYDHFSHCLWIATGDRNHECQIAYSNDRGQTFTKVGSGAQEWRTMSLMFTKEYVYWGTDSSDIQNYICRWKRPDGPLERLTAVDGPVYYSAVLNNQILLVTTAVEKERYRWDPLCLLSRLFMRPPDVERGFGEWDAFSHMWVSVDGKKWVDLAKWEKDWLSPYFFGHGIIYLADGQDKQGYFYLTPVSLKKVDGFTLQAKVKISKDATEL